MLRCGTCAVSARVDEREPLRNRVGQIAQRLGGDDEAVSLEDPYFCCLTWTSS
jgi:hypothetical protein